MIKKLLVVLIVLIVFPCIGDVCNAQTWGWKPGLSFNGGVPHYTTHTTLSSGSTAAQIQSALNSAPTQTAVELNGGTYSLGSTTITIPAQRSLRGNGSGGSAILQYTGTGSAIQMGPGWNWSARTTVNSGATQGSTSITVANASGIAANTMIVISATNSSFSPNFVQTTGDNGDPGWCGAPSTDGSTNDETRDMEQTLLVTAVNGSTLTLDPNTPLYIAYPSTPAINYYNTTYSYRPMLEQLEVEQTGGNNIQSPLINIDGVIGAVVYGCTTVENGGADITAHVLVRNSLWSEIRSNTFIGDKTKNGSSGEDYGVHVINNASGTLVEDNIFVNCRHSMVTGAGCSGNVFGYNFATGSVESDGSNHEGEDIICHEPENFMNLFEGNVAENLSVDQAHGGSAWPVFFRNWAKAWSSNVSLPLSNRWAVEYQNYTYSPRLNGNVFGRSGDLTTTDINDTSNWQSSEVCKENYSFVNGNVCAVATLGASDYYSAKPSWWNSQSGTTIPNWPAIGRDCTPVNGGNPASSRRSDLQ